MIGEKVIFLLEDHPERVRRMREVLSVLLPHHTAHVENDCDDAIKWLESKQHLVDLISLDHDLDSVDRAESPRRDHGCGRDVADYLAKQLPTCPIIIHTSNSVAGDGMFFALQRAEWPLSRIYPYNEHEWIAKSWREEVHDLIRHGWIKRY